MECNINNKIEAGEDSCTCIYNRLDFDRDSQSDSEDNMPYKESYDGKMVEVVISGFEKLSI